MPQQLIISIRYQNDKPDVLIQKIVQLFDTSKEVDLNSDDYTTQFPEANGTKSFAINLSYKARDYKTAVYEILLKANKLGQFWTVQGPVRAKSNYFMMHIENDDRNDLPKDIIGYRIILNSELS
ncbi:hypothetical protein [uncultured Dokdonia sp.]|uniref:hypothetical protein n=1 Tax=uncultured Dokdonia sp. TaxID=575653 RepID=UPI0030EF9A9D|tara:strand:- start:129474 stop:129845 length:372 start_codon:yes stop_codon:yes gene_type:complete